MAATIYRFPSKDKVTYKIALYSEIEVEVVLICLNVFAEIEQPATFNNLGNIDSEKVLESLHLANDSWIFSNDMKSYIQQILNNVETT